MIRAQRDSIRILQGALVLAVVAPIVLFVYSAASSWSEVQRLSDRDIDRTVDVVNEHALKVFEAVQRTISEVNEIIRDMSDAEISAHEQQLHRRLQRIADEAAETKSLWVFAANGRPLANSLSFPAGDTNFADRDYFNAHVAKDIGTFIGSVLRPRPPYGGAPFFGVSRRRASKDGVFDGVVQASVLPEYFEDFYRKLARDPGEYASIVRDDGVVLARYPALGRDAKLAQQGPLYQAMMRHPEGGRVTLISAIDGVGRKVAYRKLPGFPVFVLAGFETDAVVARWHAQLAPQLAFGLPATAALIGILVLALRRTRRLYDEGSKRLAAEEALRVSQRLEAVGQLTGGVAHDFNNLLMVIGGSAERARRVGSPGEVEKALSMISSAVQKGQTLTNRLLSFSRRQTLKPKRVDLGAAVSGFSEMLRQSVRGQVDLRFDAPNETIVVEVDVDELEIALLNLVLNARDAMHGGGEVTISIVPYPKDSVRPVEAPYGKLAALCVADTGIGIPADVVGRIFEPYFTTKSEHGNGLGLSQVYGFAQQSGGTVIVDSKVGEGTKICIWLPRLDVNPEIAVGNPSENSQNGSAGCVMVVDDNTEVAAVTADYLEQCGCSTVQATTAEEAIEKLRSAENIALVVSDVVMPGMGGLNFGRWLRKNRPEIPVLLMTGYTSEASTVLAEGFPLLAKPCSFDALRSALTKLGIACSVPSAAGETA